MFDTTAWAYDFKSVSINNIDKAAQYLDSHEYTINSDESDINSTQVIGLRDGYKVKITPHKITSSNYSVSKSYLGSSMLTPTIKETKEAVECLSDTWHLNLNFAKVWRVDSGINLTVKEKPSYYISQMGDLSRFDKQLYNETYINYKQKYKSFSMYDKMLNDSSKKYKVPHQFNGKNILRCELMIKGEQRRKFKKDFELKDLYQTQVYNGTIDLFLSHYFRINKLNMINPNDIPNEVKEFKNMCTAYFISAYGYDRYLAYLDSSNLPPTKKSRLKSMAKELNTKSGESLSNSLIIELDNKIKDQLNELRA